MRFKCILASVQKNILHDHCLGRYCCNVWEGSFSDSNLILHYPRKTENKPVLKNKYAVTGNTFTKSAQLLNYKMKYFHREHRCKTNK